MGRFLSFDDLPAMSVDYSPIAKTGVAVGQMISEALQSRAARRQQAGQAQQRLQLDQSVAAQNAKHDTATLSETTRHNQAVEADAVAAREAQIRAAKAEAISAGIKTAIESGGNTEVVKALNAQLTALEGKGTAPPTSAGSYPGQLSRFPGAEMGHGPGPAAQPEQAAAQVGPGNTPTAGGTPGTDVGTFDAEAIRKSLLGQPGELDPFVNMSANPGIDRRPYESAAAQAMRTPVGSPAERVELARQLAEAPARNATSLVNARQQAINASSRGQSLDLARAEGFAMRKAQGVATRSGLNLVNEQMRLADEAIALMNSGNPLSESNAFLANLRAQQGNRPTDRDLVFQLKQAGIYDRLMNAVSQGLGEGYTPEYGELFTQAAQIQKDLLTERRFKIAEAARNAILSSATIRQMVGPEMQADMAEEQAAAVIGDLALPESEGGPANQGGGASVGIKLGGQAVPSPEDETYGEEDFLK